MFMIESENQCNLSMDQGSSSCLNKRESRGSSTAYGESSSFHKKLAFCAICMDAKNAEKMFKIKNCNHSFCDDCVGKHVAAKIQENILNVKCPESTCRGFLEPQDCRSVVPKQLFDRWESALSENSVLETHKFYCPFKDCSEMLVDDGQEFVTVSECPICNRLFCAQCKVSWHQGLDCGEWQREDLMVMELAKSKGWRRCPKCKFYVEKTKGCSHIACRCGQHFCYSCEFPWPCGKH